jgi:hypothetical protein
VGVVDCIAYTVMFCLVNLTHMRTHM